MSKETYFVRKTGDVIHIFDPIFVINFYGIINCSREKLCEIVSKQLNAKISPPQGHGYFGTLIKNGVDCGLLWVSNRSDSLLVHECYHATSWALRYSRFDIKTRRYEDGYEFISMFSEWNNIGRGDILQRTSNMGEDGSDTKL